MRFTLLQRIEPSRTPAHFLYVLYFCSALGMTTTTGFKLGWNMQLQRTYQRFGFARAT